jgi:hypothetical protein
MANDKRQVPAGFNGEEIMLPRLEKYSERQMQIACADYFNTRVNLIVPNVSWGMFVNHELDLVVLTPSDYAYEIEIKTDKYDLIADKNKRHKHESKLLRGLWFAIPYYLESYISNIPERAGVLIVGEHLYVLNNVKRLRKPKISNDYKWSLDQRYTLARLGTMRYWNQEESDDKYHKIFETEPSEVAEQEVLPLRSPSSGAGGV